MVNLPNANWFTNFFTLNKITRYIATLKASDGGHIKLPQPIELQAGDEVEWIGQMRGSNTVRFLFDGKDDSAGRFYCYTDSADQTLRFNLSTAKLDSVSISNASTAVTDDSIHSLQLTMTGDAHIGFIGTHYSATSYLDQAFLGLIVRRNGNVIHNISTDVAKGTTVIPNLAQPLGTPEVESTNVTFDEPNAWSDILTSTGLTIGKSYVLEIDIDIVGQVQFINYKVAPPKISANGKYMFLVEPTDATTYVQTSQTSTAGVINSFKLTPNPHWAEYINVTDDNKELYTFDSARNAWVGENLIKYPQWSYTVTGNEANYSIDNINPTGGSGSDANYIINVGLGAKFLLEIKHDNDAPLPILAVRANLIAYLNDSPHIEGNHLVHVATGVRVTHAPHVQFENVSLIPIGTRLHSPSVKRILEVAQ